MSPIAAAIIAFLLLTVLPEPEEMKAAKKAAMHSNLPAYKFELDKLIVPTLVTISLAVARITRVKIYQYSVIYATTLLKHLENETEVQLVNGELTDESKVLLNLIESEMEVLQYNKCLNNIVGPWEKMLGGQPVQPEVAIQISKCAKNVVLDFEVFIYELQSRAINNRRILNNSLCNSVCKSSTRILNLTKFKIPDELTKALTNGTNFVPLDSLKINELKDYIEKDLVNAAVNFFRENNKIYPLINNTASLKTILEQLISQTPSNSPQIDFYTNMYNQYVGHKQEFIDQLSNGHFIDAPKTQSLLPPGTILAESDKGLGPCMLPIEWFIEQYKVQSLKGSHVLTTMSNDQCINFLKHSIDVFRSKLCTEGKMILKQYFHNSNPNFRVGVLKLVPKIHKLSKFDCESWKILPSRPIRGAENCPINPYSQALCKMLQDMHLTLEKTFKDAGIAFPAIYGCDEFSKKIHAIQYNKSVWSLNTLVSGDFSDAYTKSRLIDLQESIKKLGHLAGWPQPKVVLANELSKLVFENCYFETPSGIMRQSQGFPMGGHSSREGLDTILLSSEFEILSNIIDKNLHHYVRLVDDISLAINGPFHSVRIVLQEMARFYPTAMPLNVQISFGYSHFLDSHVYNLLQPSHVNHLTTTLAYKPLSKFEYVPFNSNIAPCYKGKPKNINWKTNIKESFIPRLCCSILLA